MAPVMAPVMRMDLWMRGLVLWPLTPAPLKRGNVTVLMAKGIHSTILPSMEQAEYRPASVGSRNPRASRLSMLVMTMKEMVDTATGTA